MCLTRIFGYMLRFDDNLKSVGNEFENVHLMSILHLKRQIQGKNIQTIIKILFYKHYGKQITVHC